MTQVINRQKTKVILAQLKSIPTLCISQVLQVSKPNSNCYAQDHKNPIDLWYINLTTYLVRRVNDLDPWEATMSLALVYNGEGTTNDCLASNCGSYDCQHKHRPSDYFCVTKGKFSMHQNQII